VKWSADCSPYIWLDDNGSLVDLGGELGSGSVTKKVEGDSDLVSLSVKDGDGVCIRLISWGCSASDDESVEVRSG